MVTYLIFLIPKLKISKGKLHSPPLTKVGITLLSPLMLKYTSPSLKSKIYTHISYDMLELQLPSNYFFEQQILLNNQIPG